jgi:hypothetical protein
MMLYVRGFLAVGMIALGLVLTVRMLAMAPTGGFAILPGLVLSGALIALGVHRGSLILRVMRARGAG